MEILTANENFWLRNKFLLVIFSISSFLSIGFGFFWWNSETISPIFANSAYYFLWASVLFYLSYFDWQQEDLLSKILRHLKDHIVPYLGAFALTLFTFVALGFQYRVLADETNLISTSLSLFLNKSLYNITEGVYFYDSLHIIKQEQVLRPALFPFLVSLLHTIFGYRPENAFLLNGVVGFFTLVTFFQFVKKYTDSAFAWTAMILLAAIPIFSMCITSAGFDAINLLFFQLVCFQILEMMIIPTGLKLEKLFGLVILAAQCRYESVLLIIPLVILVFYQRNVLKGQKFSWRLPLVPILFLPIAWQRIIGKNELYNGGDFTEHPFSLSFIPEHLNNLIEFFFNPKFDNFPGPQLIAILTVIGLIEFLIHKPDKNTRRYKIYLTGILIAFTFFAASFVQLSYYLADMRQAFIMRISNVYSTAIALMAAYALYLFAQKINKKAIAPVLALVLFFFYLPIASVNERGSSLILFREYRHNLKFLSAYPRETTLIINDRPGMYITQNRGAISFDHANRNVGDILNNFKRHLYPNILVIQNIRYADNIATVKLDSEYLLQTVYEYQNAADSFVRVSKVINTFP